MPKQLKHDEQEGNLIDWVSIVLMMKRKNTQKGKSNYKMNKFPQMKKSKEGK